MFRRTILGSAALLACLSLTPPVPSLAQRVVSLTGAGVESATDELKATIRRLQKENVRESYGPRADQCFTDIDLESFHTNKVLGKITSSLQSDTAFQALVARVRSLPVKQRDAVLQEAAQTYKPTWAQIRRISAEGQTDAGQQAEREIAEAVAQLAK